MNFDNPEIKVSINNQSKPNPKKLKNSNKKGILGSLQHSSSSGSEGNDFFKSKRSKKLIKNLNLHHFIRNMNPIKRFPKLSVLDVGKILYTF